MCKEQNIKKMKKKEKTWLECITEFLRYFSILVGRLLTVLYLSVDVLHVYAFFRYIVAAIGKKMGIPFTLVWQAIFIIIGYNIFYNHFMTMIIKPSGPKELRQAENLRTRYKARRNRKSVEKELENDRNDRFDGVS